MASFVLSFFPLDVLDEIWDLIKSVSEGFLTYSYKGAYFRKTEDRVMTLMQNMWRCFIFVQNFIIQALTILKF